MKKLMLVTIMVLMVCASCAQIEDTEVCFKKTFGEYDKDVMTSGLHGYNIFTTDLICVDARTQKYEEERESYTKDLQVAKVKFFVNWAVFRDKAMDLHKTLGNTYANRLQSETDSAIKQIIGQYDAKTLVANRGKVEEQATSLLNERLMAINMRADSVRIQDIEYSAQYEQAVNKKQVAEQEAEQEKNNTRKVEEQANQKLILAKAEADAMKIKTDALLQSQSLIEYERVQVEKTKAARWDGKLPVNVYAGAPIPFLDVTK